MKLNSGYNLSGRLKIENWSKLQTSSCLADWIHVEVELNIQFADQKCSKWIRFFNNPFVCTLIIEIWSEFNIQFTWQMENLRNEVILIIHLPGILNNETGSTFHYSIGLVDRKWKIYDEVKFKTLFVSQFENWSQIQYSDWNLKIEQSFKFQFAHNIKKWNL